MRVIALLAVLALPAAAQTTLKDAADLVRASDSEVLVKTSEGKLVTVSREAGLSAIYADMAASEYKAAESSGDAADGIKRAETARQDALRDAKAAAIDPSLLEKNCRPVCYVGYCYYPVCNYGNAIAGVRGGRKLDTSADKELAGLSVEVEEVSRGVMARSPGAIHATPHIRAGRLYEKMSSVARGSAAPAPAPAEAAPARELTPREIYAKAAPSVVVIIASDGGSGELGTGSMIDGHGRVLTNAHVVVNDRTGKPFEKVRFYLKPAKVSGDTKRDLTDQRRARVVRYDRGLDLAVLEPEEAMVVDAPLSLADSEDIQAGDGVVAIGHPEQGGLWTLTTGVVSTVVANLGGVDGKNVFQTDASINRGNSGGPLLDRRGRVIGVNTSMSRKAADGLTITAVNFAVQSAVARRWLGIEASSVASEPAPAVEAPAPAPAPEKPAAKPEPPLIAKKPEAPSKPKIVTEPKPYRIENTIEQEMQEMEDLESEMRGEIDRRR